MGSVRSRSDHRFSLLVVFSIAMDERIMRLEPESPTSVLGLFPRSTVDDEALCLVEDVVTQYHVAYCCIADRNLQVFNDGEKNSLNSAFLSFYIRGTPTIGVVDHI